MKGIDTFLIAYESRAPCVTLIDIENSICNDYNYYMAQLSQQYNHNVNNLTITKVSKFEQLFLGPLIKNQIVREILRIPDEITSMQQLKPLRLSSIFKHLENFLTEKGLNKIF